jgi:nitrate/nitrite transporter NarK
VTLAFLPDSPAAARWLTDEEREALLAAVADERGAHEGLSLRAALKDTRVLLLSAMYFAFLVGAQGIGLWLPQILKEHHLSPVQIGFTSALPYFLACFAMLGWARLIDWDKRYLGHYIVACLLGAVDLALSVAFDSLALSMVGVSFALIGLSSGRAPIFCIPPQFLSSATAAAGIALINATGNFGGFVGPYAVGWLRDATGSFTAGLYALSGMLVVSAVLALVCFAGLPPRRARLRAGPADPGCRSPPGWSRLPGAGTWPGTPRRYRCPGPDGRWRSARPAGSRGSRGRAPGTGR